MKNYNQTLKKRYSKGRFSAKKRGLSFTIPYKTYVKRLDHGCFYCGINLTYKQSGIGLDRINSDKGYTTRNTVPCCHTCNMIKNTQLSLDETKIVIDFIKFLRHTKPNENLWSRDLEYKRKRRK